MRRVCEALDDGTRIVTSLGGSGAEVDLSLFCCLAVRSDRAVFLSGFKELVEWVVLWAVNLGSGVWVVKWQALPGDKWWLFGRAVLGCVLLPGCSPLLALLLLCGVLRSFLGLPPTMMVLGIPVISDFLRGLFTILLYFSCLIMFVYRQYSAEFLEVMRRVRSYYDKSKNLRSYERTFLIVISRGTSPRGQECSLENLKSETFKSTLIDLMEEILTFLITGSEELSFLETRGT
ncbi:hypothetical protein Tco_1253896 [Tanacetum coccineum]